MERLLSTNQASLRIYVVQSMYLFNSTFEFYVLLQTIKKSKSLPQCTEFFCRLGQWNRWSSCPARPQWSHFALCGDTVGTALWQQSVSFDDHWYLNGHARITQSIIVSSSSFILTSAGCGESVTFGHTQAFGSLIDGGRCNEGETGDGEPTEVTKL